MELVGIAGAGKTTLAHALAQYSKRIILTDHPYFRDAKQIPFFAGNTFLMVPTFSHLFAKCGINCLTTREMTWMVILNGWHHVLRRRASNGSTIIIMDQGPVSLMAELYVLGPKCFRSLTSNKWWENTLKNWAGVLDGLICLDTSDPTLVKRVRSREKWHLIKEQNDQEALDFNMQFRTVYAQLVSELASNTHGPEVMHFDTGQLTLNEVVDKVLAVLGVNKGE